MVRKSAVAGALGVAFALLCAGPALALSVSLVDAGGNTVSIDSVSGSSGDWYVGLTEDYLTDNPVWIEFEQQAGQSYSGDVYIEKIVHNGSGMLWRDFHMKLWTPTAGGGWTPSSNYDGLYFTGITSSGPFAQTWYDPNAVDELWLWDGVWNPCETYTLSFSVDGWGWTGGSISKFRLEQWPTDTGGPEPDVPEPATLLLTLAGVAGLALRRRFAA